MLPASSVPPRGRARRHVVGAARRPQGHSPERSGRRHHQFPRGRGRGSASLGVGSARSTYIAKDRGREPSEAAVHPYRLRLRRTWAHQCCHATSSGPGWPRVGARANAEPVDRQTLFAQLEVRRALRIERCGGRDIIGSAARTCDTRRARPLQAGPTQATMAKPPPRPPLPPR
jgi:hypothetical protein